MAGEIGRLPEAVDLLLYAGDSALFTLTVTDDDDDPIDTTVGQWNAQIKVVGTVEAAEAFDVTVDPLSPGIVLLFLDGDTSQRLGEYDAVLRWDLQQSLDDATVTTHAGGELLVSPDVTRINLDVTLWADTDGTLFVGDLGEDLVV